MQEKDAALMKKATAWAQEYTSGKKHEKLSVLRSKSAMKVRSTSSKFQKGNMLSKAALLS